jgi:spore coat-associated protein N
MRARATALLTALLTLAAVVMAAHSPRAEAQAAALRTTGQATVSNSKNGTAILSGRVGPGDSLSGTVTISNIGSAAGGFTLELSHLTDTPGPGGGFFSRQLDLDVEDVTLASAPIAVFHGKLNSLNPTSLGTFATGAARTYRFTVTWPPSSSDSSMYGSSMSVEFDWLAGDAASTPPVTQPSAPPPPVLAPPRLGVQTAARQKVLKRGNVQAAATCDQSCTVVATGRMSVPGAAKSYKLVTARRSLPAGGKAKLKLKLPRSLRKPLRAALKAHRRVVAPITISATGASGAASRVQRKIRIIG